LRVLVLEPYYGGSHRTFLDGLQAHVPFDFILLTLPARKWKWRMRLAAPFFADKITELIKYTEIDAAFCSSFVDVATLRSLLPTSANNFPFYTYFHENQFAYPVRREDERDFHFGLTNLTTVLASDRIAFNTRYNMQTFLAGVEQILKICPDMRLAGVMEKIEAKSTILYPGIDFSQIDRVGQNKGKSAQIPVIVWNHRWEHDKNPKYFFKTLFELDAGGLDFRLIILGQNFRSKPEIFSEAEDKLQQRIIHCGFVESRDEYAQLLAQGDIVVSTAKHEFYGISVIEAVRAGCTPLLPDRLSYPELFPAQYLYKGDGLYTTLKSYLLNPDKIDRVGLKALTECFSWPYLSKKYKSWLSGSKSVPAKRSMRWE
jgi:glycosyltransferase involved in cell wall biosynthesis